MGNGKGITRAAMVLLVLIGVMLVLIAIPGYKVFRYRAEKTGCDQALKSARDGLIIEYLSRWKSSSVDEARKSLDQILPERPNICPAGGTVYLIPTEKGVYEPICGMHEADRKLKVRLNAAKGKELLGEALRKARRWNKKEPESVTITLNGRPLECERVQKRLDLRRGTATTNGYDGIVAFYGLEGDGSFSTGKVKKGEICYFVYADEDHAGVWSADDGWTGSAYQGISPSEYRPDLTP